METIKLTEEELEELIRKISEKISYEERSLESYGNKGTWDKIGELIAEQNNLYEGLIKTYSVHETRRKLESDFSTLKFKISTNDNNLTNYFLIYVNNTIIPTELIRIMNTYGWYLASPISDKINEKLFSIADGNVETFRFEAKYDTEITDEIDYDESHKIKYLHITQYSNINNIINKGLVPKSNSRDTYHPERIYLLPIITEIKGIINLLTQFFFIKKSKIKGKTKLDQTIREKNIEKYAVLEVDLGYIMQTEFGTTKPKTRLFRDPNAPGCVYTMENIHPRNITLRYIVELTPWGEVKKVDSYNQKLK